MRTLKSGRWLFLPFALPWTTPQTRSKSFPRQSTPFSVDYFDNPYGDEEFVRSTAVKASTRLVLGINKYSHDTTICAADAESGKVLFAISKERITRQKHDSGNSALLVDSCLEALNLDLDSIDLVVMNNHHHRVLPIEANKRQLEWESGLRINAGAEDGYDDPENLLPGSDRHELSHHLAHAYSTATQAPFDKGLVVVMDGMGETYRTMLRGVDDPSYTSDFSFGLDSFQCVPSDLAEKAGTCCFDWREAESVYTFAKTAKGMSLRPIFKRFTQENTPPTLFNHGFENMDSLGALYSRGTWIDFNFHCISDSHFIFQQVVIFLGIGTLVAKSWAWLLGKSTRGWWTRTSKLHQSFTLHL
jgi:hypothetical protein